MEQLLWIMGFIPKWAWFLCFGLSIVTLAISKTLKNISFLALHSTALYVVSFVVLVVSSWFLGYKTSGEHYEKQIQETKKSIEVLEAQNKELQISLDRSQKDRVVVLKEKAKSVIEYVEKEVFVNKEVVKYIETCPALPTQIIEAHNRAVSIGETQ